MLKIRDDVDLKELEKFEFKLNHNEWFAKTNSNGYIYVKPISREIVCVALNTVEEIECDALYDLIKANLVVKE